MPPLMRQRLWMVSILICLVNCFDLATTYIVSPNLAAEWNILQRQFGLGWMGLIVAKLIGSGLAIYGYAYYLRHRTNCYPPAGADRDTFCRHLTFGRRASWLEIQCGLPLRRNLGVNVGYFWAGMQALIVWVALDNLLLRYGIYCSLRHYSELGYHLMQSGLVAIVVLTRFYVGNYRRYCLLTAKPVPAQVPVEASRPVLGSPAIYSGTTRRISPERT